MNSYSAEYETPNYTRQSDIPLLVLTLDAYCSSNIWKSGASFSNPVSTCTSC